MALTTTDWQIQSLASGTHYTLVNATQLSLKDGLEACAAKAISLLNDNIQDESLYLLFEWNPQASSLNVVVTDASKQQDAPISVGADFEQTDIGTDTDNTEQVKFLLSDYLASYSAFFCYSLVAIFHGSNRADTSLL